MPRYLLVHDMEYRFSVDYRSGQTIIYYSMEMSTSAMGNLVKRQRYLYIRLDSTAVVTGQVYPSIVR